MTSGTRTGAPGGLDPEMTVHQVLDRYPGTLGTFNAYGIDSCCGGGVPVEDAARRHGVDPEELLGALRRSLEGDGEPR